MTDEDYLSKFDDPLDSAPGTLEWEADPDPFPESFSAERLEQVVHPPTGTFADIGRHGDTYSVQVKMGGMDDSEHVVQPDDPGSFTTGGTVVVATGLEDIRLARVIAFAWMNGWRWRDSTTGDDVGDIRTLEASTD